MSVSISAVSQPVPGLQFSLLLNVMFGAIASRAFAEFYQSYFDDRDKVDLQNRTGYFVLRYFVFASAIAFYVYDWIVLQKLMAKWPYTNDSAISFVRFANDIVMVFALFGVVWHAARTRIFVKPESLIVRLTIWHLLAVLWHVLARWEYGAERYPINGSALLAILWHAAIVVPTYWLWYCSIRAYMHEDSGGARWKARQNEVILAGIATAVFGASFVRTYMILRP